MLNIILILIGVPIGIILVVMIGIAIQVYTEDNRYPEDPFYPPKPWEDETNNNK